MQAEHSRLAMALLECESSVNSAHATSAGSARTASEYSPTRVAGDDPFWDTGVPLLPTFDSRLSSACAIATAVGCLPAVLLPPVMVSGVALRSEMVLSPQVVRVTRSWSEGQASAISCAGVCMQGPTTALERLH
jgi:hypothetical protein